MRLSPEEQKLCLVAVQALLWDKIVTNKWTSEYAESQGWFKLARRLGGERGIRHEKGKS